MPVRTWNFENLFGQESQEWFDNFSSGIWDRYQQAANAARSRAGNVAQQFGVDYDGLIAAYRSSFQASLARLQSNLKRGESELRIGRDSTIETVERAGQASMRSAQGQLAFRGLGNSSVAQSTETGHRQRTALAVGGVKEQYAGALSSYISNAGIAEAEFSDRGNRFIAGLSAAKAGGTADFSMRALDAGNQFEMGGLNAWTGSRMDYAGRRFATPVFTNYVDPWKEMRDAALRQVAKSGTQAGFAMLTGGPGGGGGM